MSTNWVSTFSERDFRLCTYCSSTMIACSNNPHKLLNAHIFYEVSLSRHHLHCRKCGLYIVLQLQQPSLAMHEPIQIFVCKSHYEYCLCSNCGKLYDIPIKSIVHQPIINNDINQITHEREHRPSSSSYSSSISSSNEIQIKKTSNVEQKRKQKIHKVIKLELLEDEKSASADLLDMVNDSTEDIKHMLDLKTGSCPSTPNVNKNANKKKSKEKKQKIKVQEIILEQKNIQTLNLSHKKTNSNPIPIQSSSKNATVNDEKSQLLLESESLIACFPTELQKKPNGRKIFSLSASSTPRKKPNLKRFQNDSKLENISNQLKMIVNNNGLQSYTSSSDRYKQRLSKEKDLKELENELQSIRENMKREMEIEEHKILLMRNEIHFKRTNDT